MTIYDQGDRVTSRFGVRTLNGKTQIHNGIDAKQGAGTKQRAVVAGEVVQAKYGYNYGRGNNVVIMQKTSKGTVWARHQHCAGLLVQKGDMVDNTDYVATEGTTGDVTGSHDHFEIVIGGNLNANTGEITGGKAVDPSPWLGYPNQIGTYPANNNVYDYATGQNSADGNTNNTTEDSEMAKIKIFVPQTNTPSSQLLKEGWILTGEGRLYNPNGDARMVRQYDDNISPTFEDMRNNLQPGEILMVTDD